MAECRYFPECQRCNEVGDSWIPCAGGSDGIQCDAYEPMPDVDALLALADKLECDGDCNGCDMGGGIWCGAQVYAARRIREACGEVVG